MHFFLNERSLNIPVNGDAEIAMVRHYESLGYRVFHQTFNVLYSHDTSKYADVDAIVKQLFGAQTLGIVDRFCRTIYPGDGVTGITPGHPDLLVFKEDSNDVFFCEVKQGNKDRLTVGEMVGISLIHAFLQTPVDVVRLNAKARSYRWIWPAMQHLHPVKVIDLSQ